MIKRPINVYDFKSEDEEAVTTPELGSQRKKLKKKYDYDSIHANFKPKIQSENIVSKLFNRKHGGYFNENSNKKCNVLPYKEVPSDLSFCLKDIVPYCYLENGHVFMGLTACGNFLISFKGSCEYEESILTRDYSFTSSYKYELFFWIYRPHLLLNKYYNVCLFDDHGVDDLQIVSMANWQNSNNHRILIVHGTSEKDDGDSHVTIVHIPKLGCLDCKQLRDDNLDENSLRQDILCINCNLTIHTKYRKSDTHPNFNPNINLNCPGYVIMIENSCIHTISVDLELNKPKRVYPGIISSKYLLNYEHKMGDDTNSGLQENKSNVKTSMYEKSLVFQIDDTSTKYGETVRTKNIAEEIIADFAEFETDSSLYHKSAILPHLDRKVIKTRRNYEELIITCGGSETAPAPMTSTSTAAPVINIQLINHKSNKNYSLSPTVDAATVTPNKRPIISHAYALRSKTTSSSPEDPSTAATSSPSSSSDLKSPKIVPTSNNINLYDFAEEEETDGKCEKISTFRKRRLADKKYEFSEDNTENIVPFNRIRNRVRLRQMQQYRSPTTPSMSPVSGGGASTASQQQAQQTTSNFSNNSFINNHQWLFNTTSPPNYEVTSHLHTHLHYSPQHGFRSPCGSPVGNRCLRSPPGIRSPNYHQRSPSTFCYAKTTATYHHTSALAPKQLMKNSTSFDSNIITASPTRNATQHIEEFPKFLVEAIQKANEKRASLNFGKDQVFNDTDSACSEKGCDDDKMPGVEKPVCSKKFVKRFVEEDDANSVVTNEEDDCISPGYHASLPMEVHGSCYSNMQIISKSSYNTLKYCPGVVITQNSFDLETFTFYVANFLCTSNGKKYGILYDSAYEILHVCPVSCTLTCILMLQFTASDIEKGKQCYNCSNTLNCLTHCQIYQTKTLFTWNMESGNWNCLDYGQLQMTPSTGNCSGKIYKKTSTPDKTSMMTKLTKLTRTLFDASRLHDNETNYLNHLRILDSCNEKTKDKLIDMDNMIEFYRKSVGDISSSSDMSSNDEDNDSDNESVSIYDSDDD